MAKYVHVRQETVLNVDKVLFIVMQGSPWFTYLKKRKKKFSSPVTPVLFINIFSLSLARITEL